MQLKMTEDNQESVNTIVTQDPINSENDFRNDNNHDLDHDFSHEPYVSSVSYVAPKKNTGGIIKLIIGLILIGAIVAGVFYVKSLFKVTPLDSYINNLSVDAMQTELGGEFIDDTKLASSLPLYDRGRDTFTVKSNGEAGIIYMNNKPVGVTFDTKGYSLYGISVGMPEVSISSKSTYTSSEYYEVINDYSSGSSIASYYYDEDNNTAFVVMVNQHSNKVVSVSYFNNLDIVTRGVSFD